MKRQGNGGSKWIYFQPCLAAKDPLNCSLYSVAGEKRWLGTPMVPFCHFLFGFKESTLLLSPLLKFHYREILGANLEHVCFLESSLSSWRLLVWCQRRLRAGVLKERSQDFLWEMESPSQNALKQRGGDCLRV